MKKQIDSIVFVYSKEDVINFKKDNNLKNTLFILCDLSESDFLKNSNLNFINLEKFTNNKTFENYVNIIHDFTNNLFKDFPEYTSYNGINLGDFLSYECGTIFSELLFYFKQIKPIIKNYNPKNIFVYENIHLNKASYYKYFKTDPIYEALSYFKKQSDFKLKFFPKKTFSLKKEIVNQGLKILQVTQKIIYKINPYTSKGNKIILAGSIKNLKQLINSSPLSRKFKFHTILSQPALEYNLSKSFFFLNVAPIFKINKNKKYFLKKYKEIITNKKFQNKFNFNGKNLFKLFKPRLEKIFINLFPLMCYFHDYLESLINKTKPKAVYTITDIEGLTRLLVEIANKHNIPTFVSQYGLNSPDFSITYWPSNAKYKLVWGEADKKMFMNFGTKEENIFVVGDSRFNNYESKISINKKDFLKNLGIDENKKIILFISPYVSFVRNRGYLPEIYITQKSNKKLLEIIFKTLSKKQDFHMIISPRYRSDENRITTQLLKKYQIKNVTIIDSTKFIPNDRINASDAVIGIRSTMGMETMLLKKPFLIYKLPPKEDQVEYLKYNAGYGFNSEKQLKKLLDNLDKLKTKKYLKNQEEYLKNYMDVNKNINAFEKMIDIMEKHKSSEIK